MEPVEQGLLQILKIITWPGVGALAIVIIAKPIMPTLVEWMKSKIHAAVPVMVTVDKDGQPITLGSLDRKISLLGSNHFHEVGDKLDEIKDILLEQGRKQGEIGDRTLVILTKINGNRYR